MVKGNFMRKAARFLWFMIILLAACGAAFYIGYSPLKLADESVGVLVSKTCGVASKPVEPGVFQWNWEFLIPRNAQLRTFSSKPFTASKIKTGILPGGDVYTKLFKESPSFNYSLTVNVELKVDADQCVELVKESGISTDSDLRAKMTLISDEVISKTLEKFLMQIESGNSPDAAQIKSQVVSEYAAKNIRLSELSITDVKLPDLKMYQTAKKMYVDYMAEVEKELSRQASVQAKEIADITSNMNKLEKFAGVLEKYPKLDELLKSSKDLSETLRSINAFN